MSDEIDQIEAALKSKDQSTIRILTLKYSNSERVNIRNHYKNRFGRDLIDDIDKYMSDDFKKTLMALYREPAEYDAYLLYMAMKGIGSDKDVITEIICFRNFDRIKEIK